MQFLAYWTHDLGIVSFTLYQSSCRNNFLYLSEHTQLQFPSVRAHFPIVGLHNRAKSDSLCCGGKQLRQVDWKNFRQSDWSSPFFPRAVQPRERLRSLNGHWWTTSRMLSMLTNNPCHKLWIMPFIHDKISMCLNVLAVVIVPQLSAGWMCNLIC